jgi:hypothetical protein
VLLVLPRERAAEADVPATPWTRLRCEPSAAALINVRPHSGQTNSPDFSLGVVRLPGLIACSYSIDRLDRQAAAYAERNRRNRLWDAIRLADAAQSHAYRRTRHGVSHVLEFRIRGTLYSARRK